MIDPPAEADPGSRVAKPAEGDAVTRLAVFNGSVILFVRQMLGYALKIVGLFLITRVLGPERYAPYVAAVSLTQYAVNVILDGMNAHLVLGGKDVTNTRERCVQALLCIATVILMAVFVFAATPLADYMNIPDAQQVIWVLAASIPFQLLTIPAFARLERALDYRRIATVELTGQVTYYAVATPLVLSGFNATGLALAFVVQWIVSFGLASVLARMKFAPRLDRSLVGGIVKFGFSYSMVSWTWQMRGLINPLVIGPSLGAHALGIVGMANTIVELAAFVKTIIYRIALAVMGRFKDDKERLREAITNALQFQTLAVGAVLLGFGWFSGWIVPMVFGKQWLPVLTLYPFIALGFLANAQFNVHAAVLMALDRQREVILFHLAHVALFLGTAALLVPRIGIVGYGFGELAAIPAYVVLHVFATRRVGSPDYKVGGMWIVGAGLGLFWRELGPWAIAAPFVALAMPGSLRLLLGHAEQLLAERRARVRVGSA